MSPNDERSDPTRAVPWASRLIADRRVRYLIAGGWNTLFGLGAYAALYALLAPRVSYLLIMLPAQVLAIANAYLGQRVFVFRSEAKPLGEFLRFNVTYWIAFALNFPALWLLVDVGHLDPRLAQLVLIVVQVVGTYVAHARFSFRAPPPG